MELPRDEMEVFGAQHQQAGMTAEDLQRAIDSMDISNETNFAELPEIDINASEGVVEALGGNSLFGPDTETQKTKPEKKVNKPTMASMMTAAELQKQQTNLAADRLQPEECEVGIKVEHIEYGMGEIIAMTGTGRKVTATINFPKVGNKRIRLAFSNLRRSS